VNKHIEDARNKEIIGSSLEVKLEIFCEKDIKNLLDKFSSELRFIFITSEVKVSDIGQEGNDSAIQGMRVQVKKTNHQKCVRCWHSRPEVGTIKGHESICQRCYDNVKGNGEIRIFA